VLAVGGTEQQALANRLDASVTDADRKAWSAGNPRNEPMMHTSKRRRSPTHHCPNQPKICIYSSAAPIVEAQLKAPGIRLAWLLNTLVKAIGDKMTAMNSGEQSTGAPPEFRANPIRLPHIRRERNNWRIPGCWEKWRSADAIDRKGVLWFAVALKMSLDEANLSTPCEGDLAAIPQLGIQYGRRPRSAGLV
jgi:hypothetical protein